MPATTLPCALLALALLGCADSHPPGPGAPCTLDPDGGSGCPESNPYTCWTGGSLAEGEDCENNFQCGRGLWCAQDLSTADEHLSRCEPVCDEDAHCTGEGERCIRSVYCAPPCDAATPSSCPADSICSTGDCVWTQRAADCDRDGSPDCVLGQICSAQIDAHVCWDPADYPHPFWP